MLCIDRLIVVRCTCLLCNCTIRGENTAFPTRMSYDGANESWVQLLSKILAKTGFEGLPACS